MRPAASVKLGAGLFIFAPRPMIASRHRPRWDPRRCLLATTEIFTRALAALDTGDAASLKGLLAQHPELALARWQGSDPPYDAYFHGAMLLHHVAGNPIRGELPANILDLTRMLLAAGTPVDATCGRGDVGLGGGTTLGLVASGAQAEKQGFSRALIDLLLEAGADLNQANGMVLYLAYYHTVEHRPQRDIASFLHQRGAPVDLAAAAALGRDDLVSAFLAKDGTPRPGAYALFRPARDRLQAPTPGQILQEALIFACTNGRTQTALQLLDRGAQVNGLAQVAGTPISPLHGAAWAGWPETARALLAQGADVNLRDQTHNSSPIGWAEHCGRNEIRDLLLQDPARLDLLSAVEFGCVERARELLANQDPDQAAPVPLEPGVLLRAAAATPSG
jgi:hypothetical protein